MVGSQLRSHMWVQTQYDARSSRRAAARPIDRLGCDANATGVLYTPYMCTAVFLRLCSMCTAVKISILYYLKVEGGAFPAQLAGQFRLVGSTEMREDEGVGCCKRRAV